MFSRKKCIRFNLERDFWTVTVFILNLALFDLMYCLFCLPTYMFSLARTFWPFGTAYCEAAIAMIILIAHLDWFSLGLVAVSRCLALTRKEFWQGICNRNKGRPSSGNTFTTIAFMFGLQWIYVTAINLPLFMEKSLTFGYHCKMGKCDIIYNGHPEQTFPDLVHMVIVMQIR